MMLLSGIAGAMAVANSATNPFVFLLFNVKWSGCGHSTAGVRSNSSPAAHAGLVRLKPTSNTTADEQRPCEL